MIADTTAYIITHAPACMLGDSGIVILCAWTIATAYLYYYAKSKGAL